MRATWMAVTRRLVRLGRPSAWLSLEGWRQRAVDTVVGVIALILLTSVAYHAVVVRVEGRSQGYVNSLRTMVETFTGTGYGGDAPWDTVIANLFITVVDLSTFLLLFIILPYVLAPVLEEALSPVVPTGVDAQDHVVVCGLAQQSRQLVDELEARGFEYVVVIDSEQRARELRADGLSVVHGNPGSAETLRQAGVDSARTVVVDTEGELSASVVLGVRAVDDDVRTIVLVDHLDHEAQLRYAGADQVLTPRHILGQRIAERVVTELDPQRSDTVVLAEDFAVLELSVSADQPHCGQTLAEIERKTEISVVGVWQAGEFVSDPDPEIRAEEGITLLLAGREPALEILEAGTDNWPREESTVVVAGYGIVGSTVVDELGYWTTCTVIDTENGEDIDVVGDATREETLRAAGIDDASTLVVTLGDDDHAILSVLSAGELNPELGIVARVNEHDAEQKIRRAGANYALNLTDISGRVLARAVLHEDILSYNRQLRVVRTDATPYVGQRVGETAIAETGCTVLAVQRDELRTDITPEFEIETGDQLFVVGRDGDIGNIAGRVDR